MNSLCLPEVVVDLHDIYDDPRKHDMADVGGTLTRLFIAISMEYASDLIWKAVSSSYWFKKRHPCGLQLSEAVIGLGYLELLANRLAHPPANHDLKQIQVQSTHNTFNQHPTTGTCYPPTQPQLSS